MKFYDISMKLNKDIVQWPGSVRFSHIFYNENTSFIKMDLHTGTHVDAPKHFIKDGKSIDNVELRRFFGKCQVVEIMDDVISSQSFKNIELRADNILLKTKNSEILNSDFTEDYVALNSDGAMFLVEKKINLVGIDYLSIEIFNNENFETHEILLSNDIIILEGLNLKNISPGIYTLMAFPLLIENAEASPVRAVLLEE